MDQRLAAIETFLNTSGWGLADRMPLAGDASPRRYFRLAMGSRRAVLMDADPGRGEKVDRFLLVGDWLLSHGYSAPQILAKDVPHGFLLLEDLGDALLARLMSRNPMHQAELYRAATDFLCDLHRHRPPDFLAAGDGPALAELVELTPKWYLSGIDAEPNSNSAAIAPTIAKLFARQNNLAPAMSLRDFHVENLIWLPDRKGVAKLGILDFQDAFATHPAYDLVSLLQDARRDVPLAIESSCIRQYCNQTGLDQTGLSSIYALLGAQRALRIIGIFSRLSMHFGKSHYLGFAPRVWGYLERNLAHPALGELADAVHLGLPPVTPERLQRIADKCGTYPQP